MKKALFCILFVLIFTCLLAFSVSAIETKIETSSLDEIKSAIANSSAGDSVIIDMTGDVLIPNQASAIVIDKDITVTFNFNGYTLFNKGGGGSAGKAYGILLSSIGSRLIMNGNTSVDYVNYTEPKDVQLSVSNGQIVNPNKEAGVQSPDYASDGPAIVVYSGSIELYNTYIHQYNGGEWGIFFAPYLEKTNVVHNIKAKNSIVRSPSSRYAALGTRQGSSYIVESLVEIEDCVIYGTGETEWLSMSANSYIRNSRIAKHAFKIDSYICDSMAYDGNEAILENVIFENSKISSNTGLIYVKMINCQFPNGMSLYITGDSKGKTKFTAIQDATCESGGGIYFAEIHKGSGKTFTSLQALPTVIEEYEALGHNNQTVIAYENGYLYQGYIKEGCTRCTLYTQETLAPLFSSVGFSLPENGECAISVGFVANRTAIDRYTEKTEKVISYGVFAVSQAVLGENDIFDSSFNPSKGVVQKLLTSSDNVFIIKITGFETEEHKSIKLAIGGYIIAEDENGKNISYIQANDAANGEKYSFMSFNDYIK